MKNLLLPITKFISSSKYELCYFFKIKSNITFLVVQYNLTKFYLELLANIKRIN